VQRAALADLLRPALGGAMQVVATLRPEFLAARAARSSSTGAQPGRSRSRCLNGTTTWRRWPAQYRHHPQRRRAYEAKAAAAQGCETVQRVTGRPGCLVNARFLDCASGLARRGGEPEEGVAEPVSGINIST